MVVPDTLFTGKNCIHFEEINSTNIYAADLIAKTSPAEGTCIITDFQTAGRGQIGRYWHSSAGKNLLISYIFYPHTLKVKDQFLLNVISGLAVYDVVSFYVQDVKVKWPNDIYVNNQKIAGILVQNTLRGDTIKCTIIGIGLNVNEKDFPSELPNPVSIANEKGYDISISDVFCRLCSRLEFYYLKLRNGKYDELRMAYNEKLYRKGILATFQDEKNHIFKATIEGVATDGKLILNTEDGIGKTYAFREIKFI